MTLRFKSSAILAIIFSLSCGWGNVAAQPVIMTTGEWAPYTSEKMSQYGFFTEIVSAAFQEMGRKPEYKFYPWKRCEKQVLLGSAWAAFPYAHTPERAQKFAFSMGVLPAKSVFFYYDHKMKDVTWNKLEDLKNYRIGGVLGYFYKEEFEVAKLDVQYVTKEIMNIKKLILDRIDLAPINEPVGWDLIKTHYPDRVDKFATLEKAHQESLLHLMVLKTDPASMQLLEKFDLALRKIKANGKYQQIVERYTRPSP